MRSLARRKPSLARLALPLALVAALAVACSDSESGGTGGGAGGGTGSGGGAGGGTGGGAGGGTGGGAGGGTGSGGGGGGGTGAVTCITQTPGTGIGTANDGVLTNHPELDFYSAGGDFAVLTANVYLRETPTDHDLIIYGTVENVAAEPRCLTFFDVDLDGVIAQGLVYGEPYVDDGSSFPTVTDCVAPGDEAPFVAIESNVDATLLDDPLWFDYTADSSDFSIGDYVPHPAAPTVSYVGRGTAQDCGSTVQLSATTKATGIYNLSVDVFAIDDRGLIVDFRTAYHLDDIAPTTTVGLETAEPVYGDDGNVILVSDFIEQDGAALAAASPKSLAAARHADRRAEIERLLGAP